MKDYAPKKENKKSEGKRKLASNPKQDKLTVVTPVRTYTMTERAEASADTNKCLEVSTYDLYISL
ncbi:MAG TPA: hypothetical protein IAC41_11230 [Candidatus Merdenecus merdavium]|nr:hypothetical protein [Candidatus Merdenecus merdavium]